MLTGLSSIVQQCRHEIMHVGFVNFSRLQAITCLKGDAVCFQGEVTACLLKTFGVVLAKFSYLFNRTFIHIS